LRTELELRVEERTAELQRANQDLRLLSSQLQQLQDEERRRLARELHDSVGQLLAAIAMNIEMVRSEAHNLSANTAKRVDDNAQLVEQVSTEIRTISHLLHPPLLDEVGLWSALEWYVDGFSERSKISTSLQLPPNLARLPADTEMAVFRAVQEGLTNVHRHSGSSSCSVRVIEEDNWLHVEIRDHGKGITREKQLSLAASRGGVGIRGMQERIRQLGGMLEINSSDSGTTVLVSLPKLPTVSRQEGAA
jgi:signal transduction histidine kinase